MDYSLCKALNYNMENIPVALIMYDIMCQYGVHLQEWVAKSPELSLPSSLELQTGIGLFHIYGHKDSCLPLFSPSYISGAKQVDGEIIETVMNGLPLGSIWHAFTAYHWDLSLTWLWLIVYHMQLIIHYMWYVCYLWLGTYLSHH